MHCVRLLVTRILKFGANTAAAYLFPRLLISSNFLIAQSLVKEFVRLKAQLPDLKIIKIGHLSKCDEAKQFMRDCGPHKLKYFDFNYSAG